MSFPVSPADAATTVINGVTYIYSSSNNSWTISSSVAGPTGPTGPAGSIYSNSNVASYLVSYTGNLSANAVSVTGNVSVSNNIYSNGSVYANGFYYANGTAYSSSSAVTLYLTQLFYT